MTYAAPVAMAYVALGSNLEHRATWLERGRQALDAIPGTRVVARSRVYETRPVGPVQDQGPFLNQVVRVQTRTSPEGFMAVLGEIEVQHGRRRDVRWGPRTLDLDLIAWLDDGGKMVRVQTATLELPHPRAHRRDFVLVPLGELAPDLALGGSTVSELVAALPEADRAVLRAL